MPQDPMSSLMRRTQRSDAGANDEWFTASWILQLVHQVLGEIDLDPASCFAANVTVKATCFFDKEQNGLLPEWHGKIFLNPPYGRLDNNTGYVGLFVQKALREYQLGNITDAILLLPVNATTNYFFDLVGSHVVCILRRKVRFERLHEKLDVRTMQGTMLCLMTYTKGRREAFIDAFHPYGKIILPEGVINDS